MKKILYIDDDRSQLRQFEDHVREKFPGIEPITCSDSVKAIGMIEPDLDLLLIDLEMPKLDGKKLLAFAKGMGLGREKIIILSAHEADLLHKLVPMGECLCVLNKFEAGQREVLDMILSSLEKKR